jgi:PTS system nitrogen regulatory IIA component
LATAGEGTLSMELNVRDAARLLGTPEKQIYRWIDECEIPFYRINEQPRFNRAELLEWATGRHLPVAVDFFHGRGEDGRPGTGIAEALRVGGVHTNVPGTDRESVLRAVVGLLPLPHEFDHEHLVQVLLAREAMGSTGIGDGIAIPHVRNPIVLNGASTSITLCHLTNPIPFGAIDGRHVQTIFSMISPTIRGHLDLLARLSRALHDPRFKAAVLRRAPEAEIMEEAAKIDSASLPSPGAS